jgi:hypothetical protein
MAEIIETVVHLFYPRVSNDHKAKILHPDSIFALASLLLALQLLLRSFPAVGIRILGYASNIPPQKIIELTNQRRAEAGLPPLVYNSTLSIAAKAKGEHMLANDYWAHTAPDGTEPWAFFANAGYKYKYAGENLARDFSNPEAAIEAWMASPSHRENILSGRYKEIGVAVVEGDLAGVDTTIIVQLFGSPVAESGQIATAFASSEKVTPTPVPTNPLTPTATLSPSQVASPTLLPSPLLTPTPGYLDSITSSTAKSQSPLGVIISPFDTTRSVSLLTIVLILLIMVIDAFVVYKKRIPRLSGRTLAHLAFLGTILAIALMSRAGVIL